MIRIICIGKMKDKAMRALQDDYLKRISRFNKCQLIELKEANPAFEDQRIIEEESRLILETLKDEPVIVFDLAGKPLDSVEFADTVANFNTNFSLVIGGSLGFNDSVRQRADYRVSLSKMTFPHLLARIIVLEQVFRAYKINHHQIYHK